MSRGSSPTLTRRRLLLGGAAAMALWAGGGRRAFAAQAELERFLALSRKLTGVADLDAEIGATYLTALRRTPDSAGALNSLLADGGTPSDDTLEQEILDQWYTGVVRDAAGEHVATYEDALMWRSMRFDLPPGTCRGAFGYWSKPPKT